MKPTQRPSGEKNGERPVSVPGIGVAAYSPRRLRWSWELGGVPSLNTMLEPSGAMAARKPSELPAALRTIMPPSTVHRRTTCWSVSAFARGRSQPHAATAASAAKRAVVPMAARRDAPGVDRIIVVRIAPPPAVAKAGFSRACRNAAALSNRSAGSFSTARARAAATFGGTDLRSFVTGWASSVTIFMMICWADAPVWGGLPVSISYSTDPSE
jgi:hypothetical protein